MGNVVAAERSMTCFRVPCSVETLNGLEFRYFSYGLYIHITVGTV